MFSLYIGTIAVIVAIPILVWYFDAILQYLLFSSIAFIGGCIASANNLLKVHALRHIDSTIYFPLFKLLSPLLTIIFGVVFFAERFSIGEWVGLVFGLLIPLLLITKKENARQQHLLAGLVLVLVTALVSAVSSALYKTATDALVPFLLAQAFVNTGIFVGTAATFWAKRGITNVVSIAKEHTSKDLCKGAFLRAALGNVSFGLVLFAFSTGGTLAVVQMIHSMYILIPITLAIIFYNEHWDLKKAAAIVLSVVSLGLLG